MRKEEYKEAVETLLKWSESYYTLDNPLATDEEYDMLYHLVVEHEETYPADILGISPTQHVGNKLLEGFESVEHDIKMYSLQDVFNNEEFLKWGLNVEKKLNTLPLYYSELKYDGLSLNLQYKNGLLSRAITRGDGTKGEDVFHNAIHIEGIPKTLPSNAPADIEIRGEVLMTFESFEIANKDRISETGEGFANPRNAAAGVLRSYDTSKIKRYKLTFFPYGIGSVSSDSNMHTLSSQFDRANELVRYGFKNGPSRIQIQGIDNVLDYYEKVHDLRKKLPFPIDGMVVKVDNIDQQGELGFATKYPKWAVAFKFPAVEKTTRIENVINQVGKDGSITPVAIVTPTDIDGSIVSRATLHNYDEVAAQDVRVGDTVILIKSGDIIPKITKVFKDRRDGSEILISVPTECPTCGSPVSRAVNKDGDQSARIFCSNKLCPDRVANRLKYFGSREVMDIDGLGDVAAREMVQKSGVVSLMDAMELTVDDILTYEGYKKRKAQKLYDALQGLRGNVTTRHLLLMLQIKGLGKSISKNIEETHGLKIFDPKYFKSPSMIQIEGIDRDVIQSLFEAIHATRADEIEQIFDVFQPKEIEEEEVNENGSFAGMTVCITGKLDRPRSFYAELVEKEGGTFSNSIKKSVDILIVGRDAGASKLEKAEKFGIRMVPAAELKE